MSKKINIFYVWGYASGPESSTVNNLSNLLDKNKYNVISDYYAQYNPVEAIKDINNYIKENNIDILVGSSLGGYLSLQIPNIPKIIINPCLHPEVELEKLTVDVPKMDDEGNEMKDENGNIIIEKVPAVPDHIVNFYKDFIKENDVWSSYKDSDNVIAIFGDNDEILGDKYIDEVKNHNVKIVRSIQGHGNTKESLKNFVVPEIKNIMFK